MMRKGQVRGYLVVLGGLLIYMTAGIVYTYGNLTTYLTSYIRARSHPESLNYGQSAWVLALCFTSMGVSIPFGGFISLRTGTRLVTALGSGIMSLGILLTYFTIRWTFSGCILTCSIMYGCGVGILFTSPVSCAMKWHPGHRGLVNGITLMGTGLGTFILNQVQSVFINPDNRVPDLPDFPGSKERYFSEAKASDVLDRVPQCFLLLAAICACMQVVACLMLADPPENVEESEALILTTRNGTIASNAVNPPVEKVYDVPPREVLRSKSFYMVWFMFLLSCHGIVLISALYKPFGQTFIRDDYFLSVIGSVASLLNGSGRIMWGQVVDKTSFRTSVVLMSTLMCVMVLVFIVSAAIQSWSMYVVWVCGLHLIFSGNYVFFPTVMAKAYGPKYLSVNTGLVLSAETVTGITGALLSSTIVKSLGWFGIFAMISGFSFITAILGLMLNLRDKDGNYI